MNDVTDRFIEVYNYLLSNKVIVSAKDMSEKIDVSTSMITEILKGRSNVGVKAIQNTVKTFSISPSFLLSGIGTIHESEKNVPKNVPQNVPLLDKIEEKTVTEKQKHTKIGSENIDYRLVPLYNFDAVGGSVNAEVDSIQYIEGYVPFLEAKSDDICMHVTGRSMLPTYAAGTIVLLHPVYRWREFLEYGEIYVIDLQDERRLIKEIRRSNDNCRGNFLLFSHNPDYDPIDIPKDLINKVWLVKAIYQKTTM